MTTPPNTTNRSWQELKDEVAKDLLTKAYDKMDYAKGRYVGVHEGYNTAKAEEFTENNELRAEIYSLENSHKAAVRYANEARELETKLSAATAQMEKMAEALKLCNGKLNKAGVRCTPAETTTTQYQQFKKESV